MNELERWMKILLEKDVSANGLREFKRVYTDLLYSTSINHDVDKIKMLEVIDVMGEDDDESQLLRRSLYYVYGKFVSADIYSGCIGEMMSIANEYERTMLERLMDEALNKIIKQ